MLWGSKIALVANPSILMAGAVVAAVTEAGTLQEEAEAERELQLQAGMAEEHQCLLVDLIVLQPGALQEVSLIRFSMFNFNSDDFSACWRSKWRTHTRLEGI
jgi:hypothetical protein